MSKEITQELIKELLHYDPETGIFTWKARDPENYPVKSRVHNWNSQHAGKRAGSVKYASSGYCARLIVIFYKKYYEHRLAWLYMHGKWPAHPIDHIDGDATNNAFSNLRNGEVVNMRNMSRPITNTSGVSGVSFCKITSRWRALVFIEGKRHDLGRHDSVEEAAEKVAAFRGIHGFSSRHGKDIAPYHKA
ncbi:HNH endonuclease [Vreelandella populi]|uniref:HNH endonuclease n=1 Tax=Vreelandella populi TaxID=2498858 RepID=UPI000F8F0955|nr:HNH endonuclease [Halomonas populi]RUR52709.1 HNH endonuclease [Halomonas populi]